MEILKKGVGWVVITFDDNSVKVIKTTLNTAILANYGVKPVIGYFYDLNRGELVEFREDATDISVFEDEPIFDDEVINFANRFI